MLAAQNPIVHCCLLSVLSFAQFMVANIVGLVTGPGQTVGRHSHIILGLALPHTTPGSVFAIS